MLAPPGDVCGMDRSYSEVYRMPTFGTLSIGEARAKSATGKRAALLQEYVAYIQGVASGEAGVLEPGEGETTQAIRRRLTAGGGSAGEGTGSPPHRRRRVFLGRGGPASWQASQEPGRVVALFRDWAMSPP